MRYQRLVWPLSIMFSCCAPVSADELAPQVDQVPPGRVLVTFHEGWPTHTRWQDSGETYPPETARWTGETFLLPRMPLRFDDWGIRAAWRAPVLVRMTADVKLPEGDHQLLVRARGLSRLWIDGLLVARTNAVTRSPPDGEEPITPVAQPPLAGLRPPGYHQQEVIESVHVPAVHDGHNKIVRVVFELVVGGTSQRTETGEVCVAIRPYGAERFSLLGAGPGARIPLTDAAVEPALTRAESSLARLDDRIRRQAAASQHAFWERRHDLARRWAEQNPPPEVPTVSDAAGAHPIDAFITAKIDRLRDAARRRDAQARHVHNHVLPILRERCFRCHGEKESGGLKLDTREGATRGGDSGQPAIVPGDPASSELMLRVQDEDEDLRMPPGGRRVTASEAAVLERWIVAGAPWPDPPAANADTKFAAVIDDAAFVRRVHLDTIGVPPSAEQVAEFLADADAGKRERRIDQLLDDPRRADHWMSFWLDLLAENPTLLNASLNSTGPFRWFLYDALRDDKPLDRMVTELIMMRGSPHEGGSAGFALAAENDAPYAAKGHILAAGLLGIELQCARCHDSPYHSTTQRDLYSLAAMLQRKAATVPATSRVPAAFFRSQTRTPLIRVTLQPDEPVEPRWPFGEVTGVEEEDRVSDLLQDADDSRERLAALITAPWNERFAHVMVNHVWRRLLGAGLVEPVHDWEGRRASHPQLLEWLAHQLIAHDYDVRHVERLILTSQCYQREPVGQNAAVAAARRDFRAPDRRRMTAEQVVDSLHAVTGAAMNVEELTFVHDGRRPMSKRLSLGRPTRAWMLASLNNERDRPSLSLPRAQAVVDVLKAFGWTGSRQKPIHQRDTEANVLQPGILANGTLTMALTRAAHGSCLAQLAVEAEEPARLVEVLFLRVLSRPPMSDEQEMFSEALRPGFATRLTLTDQLRAPPLPERLPVVDWFNHLRPRATVIQQELERRVRTGPPADPRLQPAWRERYEDVVWSLINHREFVWVP